MTRQSKLKLLAGRRMAAAAADRLGLSLRQVRRLVKAAREFSW